MPFSNSRLLLDSLWGSKVLYGYPSNSLASCYKWTDLSDDLASCEPVM